MACTALYGCYGFIFPQAAHPDVLSTWTQPDKPVFSAAELPSVHPNDSLKGEI
jgi:hypothetical protein